MPSPTRTPGPVPPCAERLDLPPQRSSTARRDALVLGVLATVVAGFLAWRPSAWYDEAATALAVQAGWGDLGGMLREVDLVHALYYVLLRPWAAVVGVEPFALRIPSAIGVGVAVAGTVLLGHRLGGRRLALTAGIALLVLPRVTWAGTEARSYAWALALAVLWTWAFLRALDGRSSGRTARRDWTLWGVLGALSIVCFLYTALLLPAQLVTLLLLRRRPGRAALVAAGALGAFTLLFGALVATQSAQVYWLPRIDAAIARMVVADQFFLGAKLVGVLGWAVAGVGGVLGLLALRGRRPSAAHGPDEGATATATVASVALPWLLVPLLVLVAVSVVEPRYYPRYLTFTAPAFALLLALALQRLRAPVLVAAGVAAGVLLAPGYLAQRQVVAKEASDWALVVDHLRAVTRPGDVVLYGPLDVFPGDTRALGDSYPDAVADLSDPTRLPSRTGLWPDTAPLRAEDLSGTGTVWVVRAVGEPLDEDAADARTLRAAGFRETSDWAGPATTVERWTRTGG
ncbi:glycosyltransferase family 39 protein [Kineococcus gynurae]|uniref:Glycosyltransferase family 39 protein n=1 Tax=Kineococcus gynurae TaxID=452979 RepID=A0ABV5LQK7_9ACTN